MGSNVIRIGSANIIQLGFLAYFDLDQNKLLLDITGQTLFNSGGAAAVAGISFAITGPGGIILASVDFTTPHIVPSEFSTYEVDLPGGYGQFGFYTIQASIKDADAQIYSTLPITKGISKPFGYTNGAVPGNVFIEPDLDIPQLLITENSNTAYCNLAPISRVVSGILSYPPGTLSDLAFTSTPFLIGGAGLVFTGRYTLNNKTICTYDLNDGILAKIPYVVRGYEKVIDTNTELSQLLCCIMDIKSVYTRDPLSAQGKSAKQKLDNITIPFYTAILKEKSGQSASEEIDQIKKELNCNCGSSSTIEPRPVLGVGLTGVVINITGSNAAAISSSVSGSTKTFNVNVKNVLVEKDPDDLGFNIVRSESDNQIIYSISFNYAEMATNILEAIQNDENLTQLLNKLITAASPGLSLNGLDGKCVITLNSCNYDLIETATPAKTINSITIGGVVKNAPGGLLVTDTTATASWLNGLGLGSFSSFFDSTTNTVLIESLSNANVITALSLNINGATVIRQFTRSCIGLVDLLNAIITYICAIDSTRVKFGVTSQVVNFFNEDGTVGSTALNSTDPLGTIITEMLAAQTILFNAITNISFTCAHAKALFTTNTNSLITGDGLYGLRGGVCAEYLWSDVITQILAGITADSGFKATLCALVNACAPVPCAVVTSLSAVYAGGNLTVNCNDADPSTSLQVRYRIFGSSDTYTVLDTTSGGLPLVISGVAPAQYEVGMRKLCTNGQYSSWVTTQTTGCAQPISFSATKSGSNFVVNATLVSSQTIIEVQMTDPNGGVTNTIHDFGGPTGTFNIAIPDPTLYGNYIFLARGVCNNTSDPRYVSNYLSPVVVNNPDPSPPEDSRTLTPVIVNIDDVANRIHVKFSLDTPIPATQFITYTIAYVTGGMVTTGPIGAMTSIVAGNVDTPDISFAYNGDVVTSVVFNFSTSPNPNGGITMNYTSPQSVTP